MHLWFAFGIFVLTKCLYVEGELSYTMEMDKFIMMSKKDPASFGGGTFRINMVDRNTFALTGDIESLKNYGNEDEVRISVYTKNPALDSYNPVPVVIFQGSVCEAYDKLDLIDDLAAASNAPPKGTCPILQDKYVIDNFVIGPDNFPKNLPSGKYKIQFTVSNTNKLLFGYEVFGTVTK